MDSIEFSFLGSHGRPSGRHPGQEGQGERRGCRGEQEVEEVNKCVLCVDIRFTEINSHRIYMFALKPTPQKSKRLYFLYLFY